MKQDVLQKLKKAAPWISAILLFLVLSLVYAVSVPGRFNTVRDNRRFFDSDGEFITRQFALGKTFTHNDHLLYHVAARWLCDHLGLSAVRAHKAMDAAAGAAGVSLLLLIGWRLTGRPGPAVAAALAIGGCAGWWFFSATIDTYLPNLACSILALGLALECLRTQALGCYAALGAAMGLAFLFRTDSFLLAGLFTVSLADTRRWWLKCAACGTAALLVGLGGYAFIAHQAYGVTPDRLVPWMLGHEARPEALHHAWGSCANITRESVRLALVNQLAYTELLPGLASTRSPSVVARYVELGAGATTALAYAALLLFLAGRACRSLARGGTDIRREQFHLMAMAAIWLLSRTLFYAWWDPRDPFLFAVMSLPALWLVVVAGLRGPGLRGQVLAAAAVTALALVLWSHNFQHLVLPLRALP